MCWLLSEMVWFHGLVHDAFVDGLAHAAFVVSVLIVFNDNARAGTED